MAGFIQLPEPNQEPAQQRFQVIRRAGGFEQQIDLPAIDPEDAKRQAAKLFAHRKGENATYIILSPGSASLDFLNKLGNS